MIVFDATFLLLLLSPDTPAPIDPSTGAPVSRCQERIAHFIETLTKGDEKIIIPTPALAEALIYAGQAGPEFLNHLRANKRFQVAPFTQMAAVEAAEMMRKRIQKHGTLKGDGISSRAKVKFDIQIAAIARVTRATTIYTDDQGLQGFAASEGFATFGIADLPLPPEDAQQQMDFEGGTSSSNA